MSATKSELLAVIARVRHRALNLRESDSGAVGLAIDINSIVRPVFDTEAPAPRRTERMLRVGYPKIRLRSRGIGRKGGNPWLTLS